ncbi:MAG TPA: aspartyl/asparaginyl beta-hydroxylase domain-containing protein [Steroidobacteraceae bacterium]|nr:aspartyl/asparaginyl beta-hydroxylase domain-containing protein [Steroidobacteraceae bacterium]
MSASAAEDTRISSLITAADQAAEAGRHAEAARLLESARAAAPGNPRVLNALGMHALKTGEFAAARQHLEEAVRLDARAPLLWLHLAMARRAQGDAHAEAAALEKALELDPYFSLALLQKATLLERRAKPREAARVYRAFLQCVPPVMQQTPALRQGVERARAAVASNAAALEQFLQARLAATRAAHRPSPHDRFDHCLDILMEKRRVYTPQPTLMYFPRLPALEFYERADFPWLEAFEAATDQIRAELLQCLADDADQVVPYVDYPAGAPLNQWRELNRSRRWGAYYLIKGGVGVEAHLRRCPKTAALLATAPLARVPGEAPNAFFSILEPRTRIPPHTGVSNTRLVVHVPLVIPAGCGFRVGSETREWRPGEAWVFDDTIEHEAWNGSEEPRAILILDTWNPLLTDAERDLVSVATAALNEYYRE